MTLINGAIALLGAIIYLRFKKNIHKIIILLVSFTTGALLGGALFHFIPEALEELNTTYTFSLALMGFFAFFVIEKFLHWHHHHDHDEECHEHPFTYLLLWGDAIHNFVDGVIIAGAFIVSIPLGILTSILIMAHELPMEISDFGTLIYGGLGTKKAVIYNFLSQLTAVLGGIIGFFFLNAEAYAVFLLPFAAGGFLYIAITDLIPEILKEKNKKKIFLNLLAILAGLALLLSSKLLIE
jgi:zinc and cadmium transporter